MASREFNTFCCLLQIVVNGKTERKNIRWPSHSSFMLTQLGELIGCSVGFLRKTEKGPRTDGSKEKWDVVHY